MLDLVMLERPRRQPKLQRERRVAAVACSKLMKVSRWIV